MGSPGVENNDVDSGDSDIEQAEETQNEVPRSTKQPLHKKRKENKQKKPRRLLHGESHACHGFCRRK